MPHVEKKTWESFGFDFKENIKDPYAEAAKPKEVLSKKELRLQKLKEKKGITDDDKK